MQNSDKYFEIGKKLTSEAAEYLLRNFGDVKQTTHKSDFHYGIKEDLELNNFYETEFSEHTPEIGLYTEEGTKDLNNELTWVVDPLEGTSNYSVGIPFYATQIALLHKKEPVLSIISAPSLKQEFWAIKGKGAFLNGKKIHVSKINTLNRAMISIGKGTKEDDLLWYGGIMKNIMGSVRTFRNFGSCGLELAYTACGMIDVYINKGSHNIYDYAPGALIAKESGAKVCDFNGNEWNISENTIVAANDHLLPEILRILKN